MMGEVLPPTVNSAWDLSPLTEWFSVEEDGQQTFSRCTFGFVAKNHQVYLGHAPIRKYDLSTEIINKCLKLIPDREVYPEAPPNITVATVSESNRNVYIKGPALSLYETLAGTGLLPDLLLQEAKTMEFLSHNGSHPNIVQYHGCLVERGRVVGIVLARLPQILQYRFADAGVEVENFKVEDCMRKIESAVRFLHSLGRAHNDLKPTNIMLDSNDEPFIIDFGSCRPFGALLITGGTQGWVDEDHTHSAQRNDEIALEKIRFWLNEQTS